MVRQFQGVKLANFAATVPPLVVTVGFKQWHRPHSVTRHSGQTLSKMIILIDMVYVVDRKLIFVHQDYNQ